MKYAKTAMMATLFALILISAPAFAQDCPPDCGFSQGAGFVHGGVYDNVWNETTWSGNEDPTHHSAENIHDGEGVYESGNFSGRATNSSAQFDGYNRSHETEEGSMNHHGSNFQEAETSAGVNSDCPYMSITAGQYLNGNTDTNQAGGENWNSMVSELNVNGGAQATLQGVDPNVYMRQVGDHGYSQIRGAVDGPQYSWQGGNTTVETQIGTTPPPPPPPLD